MAGKLLTPQEQIAQQIAYASSQPASVGLADDNLFVLGMKDVYYKNEGNALADILDNSIEAGSSYIHIAYNTDSSGRIQDVAVIDNGCGIDSTFLPHALRWGGSSRHNSRNLYGRYGFGLPTASIKHGNAYSVYSRTDKTSGFSEVSIDLDEILAGKRLELPSVKQSNLPSWVSAYIKQNIGNEDDVATVVLLSKRNTLEWPNKTNSVANLMRHFGIVYHSVVTGQCKIYVDGDRVEAVDPLFITPAARHYEIEGSKATDHSLPPIKVRDAHGTWHDVQVRMSMMNLDAYDAQERTASGRLTKPRKRLKEDYNGIFIYRNGRFIDTYKWDEISWQSYSRQIGISLDFPAELDEFFGITPQKQTISVNHTVQELLKKAVLPAYASLYKLVLEERATAKSAKGNIQLRDGVTVRASELAFAKIDAKRPSRPKSPKADEEARTNLANKAKEISKVTGRSVEEEQQALENVLIAHPYKIEAEHGRPTQPFFEMDQVGPQTVVYLNTGHRFYTDVYGALGEDDVAIRSGIEALLVCIARAELSKGGDDRVFYMQERAAWSEDLAKALEIIPQLLSQEDTWEEAIDMDPARNSFDDMTKESE
jgi:hypothetical protein